MRARAGQTTKRIEDAVTANSPVLLSYFARRVDPPDDAADLLAETLLVLWKRAAALPSEDDEVRPWMFGIARNVLLHHYRGKTRQHALVDRLRSLLAVTARPGFVDVPDFDGLHAALRTLDEVDGEIIRLHHWDGLTLAEASRVLRMKEGTVRSRYHRARTSLRTQLEMYTPVAEQTSR
ncbi:RNA polymerase sigma factor [Salinibacterium sp. ZJ450]|uniref:RNA polymerase sigma factor n=1 Tax=Salinibacterium sp. ZJ450 TaxID=2708338 RepID=UPI001420EC05|nr:sigma-70 family RNA polymerase sigma factor [Salinibacterium sp. ZJ450]